MSELLMHKEVKYELSVLEAAVVLAALRNLGENEIYDKLAVQYADQVKELSESR